MFNQEAVAQYNELIGILKEMPVPTVRRDLTKNRNIRWLRRSIKKEWHPQAERALELLALCDETQKGYCGGASPVWQETVRQSYADRDALKQKYLTEKGLEVTSNGWPGTQPKVYAVKLNFTPEEWLDLMNTEGEFLPACCATISHVRDVLIATVREGGFIRATDLYEIVEALKGHHECGPEGGDPESRLIQTWEAIKDDADLHLLGHPIDPNDLDDAFSVLYHAGAVLSWNFLNSDATEDEKYDHEMVRRTEFVRVLPAIRTIYKALSQNTFEPMEGYAIAEGDQVLSLTRGLAIFRTKEQAERLAERFNKEQERDRAKEKESKLKNKFKEKAYGTKEEPRKRIYWTYTVRPVRVTVENGIEFTDVASAPTAS